MKPQPTHILFVAALLCLASCHKDDKLAEPGVHSVCFATDAVTKTILSPDASRVSWAADDVLSLWASDLQGNTVLTNQKFVVYGLDGTRAVFTSNLPEEMAPGLYNYIASCPSPSSLSGSVARFELPSRQDGRLGSGADIMLSSMETGHQLGTLNGSGEMTMLNLNMHHLVHMLKFYLPEGSNGLNGEPVSRMAFTIDRSGAGSIEVDLSAPNAAPVCTPEAGSVILEPAEALTPSASAQERNYLCAAVLPADFTQYDMLCVKLYSANYSATLDPIPLVGRSFKAGHSTPVALRVASVEANYNFRISLNSNNIGEPVRKLSIYAPTGCVWGDNGASLLTLENASGLTPEDVQTIIFSDPEPFLAFAGKTLSVVYDTDHIMLVQNVTLPSLEGLHNAEIALDAPYLLNEDFSQVTAISSNDAYSGGSIAGDKTAVAFLDGWSGARMGATAGGCIRLAARREGSGVVNSNYAARVDSAPLAVIKAPVDLELSFDYGVNNKYSFSCDFGSTTYVGYVNSNQNYSSDDESGVYETAVNFITSNDKDSDWSTPRKANFVLSSVEAGSDIRISWRTVPEKQGKLGNTTNWFYIDNVKVRVKQ